MAKSNAISLFATPTSAVATSKPPAIAPASSTDGSFERTLKSARKKKPAEPHDDATATKAEKPATKKPAKAAKPKRSQADATKDQEDAGTEEAVATESSKCNEQPAANEDAAIIEGKADEKKDQPVAVMKTANADQAAVAANHVQPGTA